VFVPPQLLSPTAVTLTSAGGELALFCTNVFTRYERRDTKNRSGTLASFRTGHPGLAFPRPGPATAGGTRGQDVRNMSLQCHIHFSRHDSDEEVRCQTKFLLIAILFRWGDEKTGQGRHAPVCRHERTRGKPARARNPQGAIEDGESEAFFLPCSVWRVITTAVGEGESDVGSARDSRQRHGSAGRDGCSGESRTGVAGNRPEVVRPDAGGTAIATLQPQNASTLVSTPDPRNAPYRDGSILWVRRPASSPGERYMGNVG
jgi:hypothetical protein